MATCTQSEFADLLGKDKSYVTRLKQAGRLVMVGEGRAARVDMEATQALLARTADPSRAETVKARDAGKGRAPQREADTDIGNLDDDAAPQAGTRAYYQRIALRYDNQLVKLGMMLARRMRYPREAVRDEPRVVGALLRAAIERMIDQTAARHAVNRSQDARHALNQIEAKKIKRVILKEFVRALRRMGKYSLDKKS